MSKLDDELSRALEEPVHVAVKPAGQVAHKPPPAAASTSSAGRNLGLLAALVGIVAAVILFFMFGLKDAAIYALPVSELTTNTQKFVGRKVRLEGELTPGTLLKRDQPCEYRFTVQGIGPASNARIPVRYGQCVVPDTFRDMPGGGVQVTVEGALNSEGYFEASQVMAKCTSKYDPSTHQMTKDKKSDPNTPIN